MQRLDLRISLYYCQLQIIMRFSIIHKLLNVDILFKQTKIFLV